MCQTDADQDCSKKVANKEACGKPKGGILDCHRFYHCVGGVAYMCQNPKLFYSTCSGTYSNIAHGLTEASRMSTYKCPKGSSAHGECSSQGE